MFYLGSYFGISKANLVLEKIEGIEMTEEAKNHYMAEARFLRGLYYFNLVQYFGGVPITTEVYDYNFESSLIPRSTATEVYDFVVADLEFAEAHLPLDSFEEGDLGTGRASASAASGLLAKVWLTRAGHPLNEGIPSFQKAKDYAQKVVDYGIYSLQDDYGKIFTSDNENNKEWLFSVQFGPLENDQGNWGGWHNTGDNVNYDQPYGSGYGRIALTEEMVDAWHDDDPRKDYIIVDLKGNGKVEKRKWKWKTRKFRFAEDNPAKNFSPVNAPVLRYADILLVLAEAENEINGPTQLAMDMVNLVRERARKGIPSDNDSDNGPSLEPADITTADFADAAEFRDAMIWERARELCMEGLDRFDLVRSGKYMELTESAAHLKSNGGDKKVLDPLPHFALLPLPSLAMRNNSALQGDQNPGY